MKYFAILVAIGLATMILPFISIMIGYISENLKVKKMCDKLSSVIMGMGLIAMVIWFWIMMWNL